MGRTGGTYVLWSREGKVLSHAMVTWSGRVSADEAVRDAAAVVKQERTPAELEGCRLWISGPFGTVKYVIVIVDGQTKLRKELQ